MTENNKTYTFLRWNEQYGAKAKFIVRNNQTGQQALFTPGRTEDMVWTKMDLSSDEEMKNWSDFGNETVDDLESVAF